MLVSRLRASHHGGHSVERHVTGPGPRLRRKAISRSCRARRRVWTACRAASLSRRVTPGRRVASARRSSVAVRAQSAWLRIADVPWSGARHRNGVSDASATQGIAATQHTRQLPADRQSLARRRDRVEGRVAGTAGARTPSASAGISRCPRRAPAVQVNARRTSGRAAALQRARPCQEIPADRSRRRDGASCRLSPRRRSALAQCARYWSVAARFVAGDGTSA